MKKLGLALLSLTLLGIPVKVEAQALTSASSATAQACTSIALGTITWVFTTTYTCGRHATGDFWVTNSGGSTVSIKSISPAYTIAADGSARNGSMLNPGSSMAGYGSNGFDSRTIGHSTGGLGYTAGNNVGITMPLVITEGSSLLSSESYGDTRPGGSHQSYIKQIQVLTVVTANANVGDFRPSYIATVSKASPANVSSIDYGKLHSVVPPTTFTNTYSVAFLDTIMVEPQIELEMSTKGRYLHAGDNYSPKVGFSTDYGYGQNIGMAIGVLSMAVNSNYTNGQKANWVIRLIQHGIDLRYALDKATGTPQQGIRMLAGGSHTPAKIFVMAFAGWMLGNADLAAWGDHAQHPVTNESNQYFYVAQSDICASCKTGASSATNCTPAEQYPQSSLNEPEWGSDHKTSPQQDNHSFTYHACYRDQVGQATNSEVLAMKMMGMKLAVNLPQLFEYYEQRYMPASYSEANFDTNTIRDWQRDFWQTYKDITPPSGGTPPTNVNPTLNIISAVSQETTSTTGTVTLSYADSDGTVSSVAWTRTAPTSASGSCSLVAGTATCSGLTLTGAANNAFSFIATDNSGGTSTAVLANILRRTCPATPADTFDVNGGWSSSLGPCWLPMTTNTMNIGVQGYAQTSSALARHLAYMPWSGGAPDDYKVQVTSTSNVTEVSFLLFGCFSSYTSAGIYNGYVMSMQGLGTNLARYDAGQRVSLAPNTQVADGNWIAGETGTLECEDTGSSVILRAYDQNNVLIVSATDSTAGRYTSGEAFAGGWGGATFDGFVATSIVGGPGADTTPPTLGVTVPVNNPADTNDSTYNLLAGTAVDNVGVTSITCLNVTTSTSCTVTGLGPWSVASVTLTGTNIIRFQACDAATNCSVPYDVTLNYSAASSGTILVSDPGPARTEPYFFRGDQTNFRGACSMGTDHVEILVAGVLIDPSGTPASSAFVSGTTAWVTIQPIPIPKNVGDIVPVEFRCVQGDSSYASSILNMSSLRVPNRGR